MHIRFIYLTEIRSKISILKLKCFVASDLFVEISLAEKNYFKNCIAFKIYFNQKFIVELS